MAERAPEPLLAGPGTALAQSDRRALIIVAWTAVLLLSKLPLVIARELMGTDIPWITAAWIGAAVLLVALAFAWSTLKPLRAFFTVMLAIFLVTTALEPAIVQSAAWQRLVAEASPMVTLFGERALIALEALLVLSVLFLMGFKRQDAFLVIGNLNAPAAGIRSPGRTQAVGWMGLGTAVTLLLGGLFVAFMASQNPGILSGLAVALPWLTLILASAALNAFGEEAMYRAAPLATLHPVVGPTQALWMTAIWFGLGHTYGSIPAGLFGFVYAGLLGLLLGKAMLDTRGMGWSWFIHLVLDTIIYLSLAATMS